MAKLILLTLSFFPLVFGKFFNTYQSNKSLIVLSAPSIRDDNFKEDFIDIISFQIDLAKIIHEYDNVIVLADKHTMPYLDGRSPRLNKRLPVDALIEANIHDVNINDFSPMGFKQFTKFKYRSSNVADITANQLDFAMNQFLTENKIKIDKWDQEMIISGEEVVHNGVNKAVISDSVIFKNAEKVPEWAMMIKLLNSFKKVLLIGNPLNDTRLRFDDIFAFIDEEMLAISPIEPEVREELELIFKRKFRKDLELVDVPLGGPADDDGNCGIYTAMLSTSKQVYFPVFGNDPSNWEFGYSTMIDRMVLHLLEANSRRKIVPINIPRVICRRGFSLKSLTWVVKGYSADSIIRLARQRY